MEGKRELLQKIRELDFVLYETVLFLDGDPCNREALDYYHETRKKLAELRAEYARCFGPLTIYDNEDAERWQWVDCPFPWQKEAN